MPANSRDPAPGPRCSSPCAGRRRPEPLDHAGPLAQALGRPPCSTPRVEHDLHADADAEHRTAAGEPPADHLVAAHGAQAGHAGGEGADAGHDQAVGRLGRGAVGGQLDLGADALERADGGAHVAEAVVEHDHVGTAAHRAASRRRRRTGPGFAGPGFAAATRAHGGPSTITAPTRRGQRHDHPAAPSGHGLGSLEQGPQQGEHADHASRRRGRRCAVGRPARRRARRRTAAGRSGGPARRLDRTGGVGGPAAPTSRSVTASGSDCAAGRRPRVSTSARPATAAPAGVPRRGSARAAARGGRAPRQPPGGVVEHRALAAGRREQRRVGHHDRPRGGGDDVAAQAEAGAGAGQTPGVGHRDDEEVPLERRPVVPRAGRGVGPVVRARSERALGAGHALDPRVDRDRGAQRTGDRLELGLDDVVRVAARRAPARAGRCGVEGERLEDVPGQRAGVRAPPRRRRSARTPAPSGSPVCTQ